MKQEEDLYFKKSKDRGKVYMRIFSKKEGYILNLGSPEKCIKDSVRLKELEKQTEHYLKILTEKTEGKK